MRRGLLSNGAWTLLVVAGLLAVPGQARAVAPAAGERYDGTSRSGIRIFLKVNAAGTRLADYDFGGELSCTDGRKRSIGLFARGEKPTAIGPDGSFSYTSKSDAFTIREKVAKPVRGRAVTAFSGSFTTPDTSTVSVTTTFRSKRFTCTGTTPLTLSRDGTSGAPFRDASLATGDYRARGRGVRVTSLRTLAPGDELQRFRLATTLRCRNGRSYGTTFNFDQFLLSTRSTGLFTGTGSFSIGGGFRARQRYRVTIAFRRAGGRYVVTGRLRARSAVTRGGRRATTCTVSRRFAGAFVRGPKNLF